MTDEEKIAQGFMVPQDPEVDRQLITEVLARGASMTVFPPNYQGEEEITQPEGKLRICRNPACMIVFDPTWRVRLTGESTDAENLCPKCGMDLNRNLFIRRPENGETEIDRISD